jgi:hypothetical protein
MILNGGYETAGRREKAPEIGRFHTRKCAFAPMRASFLRTFAQSVQDPIAELRPDRALRDFWMRLLSECVMIRATLRSGRPAVGGDPLPPPGAPIAPAGACCHREHGDAISMPRASEDEIAAAPACRGEGRGRLTMTAGRVPDLVRGGPAAPVED